MGEKYEGKLIALEGPDGCGKSTQAKLLSKWLKSEGYDIKMSHEPTDNPLGQILRDSLKGKIELPLEAEALLFAGDRALHVSDTIRPNLEEGKIVITERYIHSSLAYQTSRGLSKKWVRNINKPAIHPDLTIFIDVPPKTGLKRMNSRKLDNFEKNPELQKDVREAFRELAEDEDMPLVDGTQPEGKVADKIKTEVEKILHADSRREG